MKNYLSILSCSLMVSAVTNAQTLTLVTGKRLYDHHSSSLSGTFYGYNNVNAKSGYDFINHANLQSASNGLAYKRDMVEHNGPYGGVGFSDSGFGFTDSISNLGGFNYKGNNLTRFYLNNSVDLDDLHTVQDLVINYDSTATICHDEHVAAGNLYIIRVRNTNMYVAMKIKTVSNLTATQYNSIVNMQDITADVFFEFDYKYGTLPAVYTGIDESEQKIAPVSIYPNPAGGQLVLSSATAVKNYKISTATGQYAKEGLTENLSNSAIDVSSMAPGIYFLELYNDAGVLQRSKFIKE